MPAIRGAVLDQIGVPRPYWRSKPISVVELHLDPPDRGEVLVRIEAAGVCHSDLSVVDGTRVRPVPILLGHEAAGIVEQVGDGVDGVAVGQRVVLVFLPRCGQCAACATDGRTPCEPGSAANKAGTLLGGGIRLSRGGRPVYHHLGVSGFATHVVVNRASVVPVPHEVPPTVAALLGCAVLTGGGAVLNVGDPQPGQSVAVVGLGGVGMAAVLTALTYTDVRVVAVDQLPEKLSAAKALGAHEIYTPQQATAGGVKAAVVVEAVGHPAALHTAIGLTAPGGRTITPDQLVAVGFCHRRPVTDRQLSGFGGAQPRHSPLRVVVAIGPSAGGVAGDVNDSVGRYQRGDGPPRRWHRGASAHQFHR